MNSSLEINSSMTQASVHSQTEVHVKTVFVILTLVCFCCFLYLITVLLIIFFTTVHVRESARYVLFAHMLIIDTLYLVSGLILFIGAIYVLYLPVPFCYLVYTLANVAFKITPYNLALMSLECYVAICFPLRHSQFCNAHRANYAIVVMWVIGLIPNLADFIIISSSIGRLPPVICSQETLIVDTTQDTIRSLTLIISFTVVGLTISYSYVRVMIVARTVGSGKSSALKAGKTVMLHAFQLLLCMTSSMSAFTQKYPFNYLIYFPLSTFLLFTCLPRFLSPLIYGLRDEVFYKHIRKSYCRDFTEYR